MPAILEWTHTVVEHDLDGPGHANNISSSSWGQVVQGSVFAGTWRQKL